MSSISSRVVLAGAAAIALAVGLPGCGPNQAAVERAEAAAARAEQAAARAEATAIKAQQAAEQTSAAADKAAAAATEAVRSVNASAERIDKLAAEQQAREPGRRSPTDKTTQPR